MSPGLKSKLYGFAILLLIVGVPMAATAQATPAACAVQHIKSATVVKVLENANLQLADGDVVRLIGVMPLKLFKTPKSKKSQWFNELAQDALTLLRREVEGKTIELHQEGRKRDRYNRILAHIFTSDGHWIQGLLLRSGLARSYSYRDNRACMKEMLALEEEARRKAKGLWRARTFQPINALQTERLLQQRYRYALVEGVVQKIAVVRSWIFMNFDTDWRSDFTIAVKRKYRKKILPERLDLSTPEGQSRIEGKKIRVRGWIEYWNGPVIKVTHGEQIEFLEEKSD